MGSCKSASLQRNTRRRAAPIPKKVLVIEKFQKLRRLVPGGHRLRPDQLFLQTADYILHLKFKVHVLEAILKLHGTSDH